jgi:hypothetical protein
MTRDRLTAEVAAAEREYDRLDAQGDRSASVKAAALSIRLRQLRAALAACEEGWSDHDGFSEIDATH